jgi:hypothetical protein
MAEAKKILPTVKVSHRKNKGKCPVVSDIEISMEGKLVATGTLGGEYTEAQVLSALRGPDKKRFEVKDPFLFATLT